MGQKENMRLLLQLHHIITGTNKSVEEIVSQRTVDRNISLIYNTNELGGKVFFGEKVPIEKYYSLGDQLETRRSSAKT